MRALVFGIFTKAPDFGKLQHVASNELWSIFLASLKDMDPMHKDLRGARNMVPTLSGLRMALLFMILMVARICLGLSCAFVWRLLNLVWDIE